MTGTDGSVDDLTSGVASLHVSEQGSFWRDYGADDFV